MTKTLLFVFSLISAVIISVILGITILGTKAIHTIQAIKTVGKTEKAYVLDKVSDKHVEQVLYDYIDKNIDKIVERIIENMRGKGNEENKIARYKDLIFDFSYPHTGNENGQVVVAGFFDYSCGYCKLVKDHIKQLINDNKIKYIFRDVPILGDVSLKVAKSALAVYFIDESKYFDFHYAALDSKSTLSDSDILKVVKNVGITEDEFNYSMENNKEKIEEMLNNSTRLVTDLGAGGVPFIIIGNDLFVGVTDLSILRKAVDKQLAAINHYE